MSAGAERVDVLAVIRKLSALAKHAPDCAWTIPLPTGDGYYHCTCGLDSIVLDGEPCEQVGLAIREKDSALRYVVEFDGQPMSADSYKVVAKRARAALARVEPQS